MENGIGEKSLNGISADEEKDQSNNEMSDEVNLANFFSFFWISIHFLLNIFDVPKPKHSNVHNKFLIYFFRFCVLTFFVGSQLFILTFFPGRPIGRFYRNLHSPDWPAKTGPNPERPGQLNFRLDRRRIGARLRQADVRRRLLQRQIWSKTTARQAPGHRPQQKRRSDEIRFQLFLIEKNNIVTFDCNARNNCFRLRL